MKEKDLISIIIPVYNVSKYLKKCLDSVTNQTYKNLEILIIDDGSTDDSGSICDEYSKKDKRIKVFHKENEGISPTRKLGMNKASGKYVCFVDSDDWVENSYVETLYNLIIDNNCKLSIANQNNIFEKEKIKTSKLTSGNSITFTREEALKNLFYQNTINCSLWGKMYDKELLVDLDIPNYETHEDLYLLPQIIEKVDKIVYSDERLYNYVIREGSLIHNKFNKKTFDILNIIEKLELKYQNQKEVYKALNSRKINACFYVYRQIPDGQYNTEKVKIKNMIKSSRRSVLKDNNVRFKTKVAICLSYISFSLIKPLYKMFSKTKYSKKID